MRAPPPPPTSGATTTAGATGATGATTTAGATGRAATEGGRGLGHHRRVGARHAGTSTVAGGRGPRRALVTLGAGRGGSAAGTGRRTAAHALGGRERVVARARSTRTGGAAGTSDRTRSRGCRTRRTRAAPGHRRLEPRRPVPRAAGSADCGRGLLLGRRTRTRTRTGSGPRLRGSLGDRRGGLDRRCGCRRSLGGRCRRRFGSLGCRSGGGGGLRGRLGGRLPCRFLGRLLRCRLLHPGAQLGPVLVLELLDDGGLDAGRRGFHELPEVAEHRDDVLALDAVLLGEFTDSDLGHAVSSRSEPLAEWDCGPLVGLHAHREVLIAGS